MTAAGFSKMPSGRLDGSINSRILISERALVSSENFSGLQLLLKGFVIFQRESTFENSDMLFPLVIEINPV